MPNRRDFHRLTLAAAAGTAVPPAVWATATAAQAAAATTPQATGPQTTGPQAAAAQAAAAPTVTETGSTVTVDNGPVRLVVTKSSGGRATSLRLNGTELLGGGGVGYFDVVSAAVGTPVSLPASTQRYTVRRGTDFVDVACEITPTRDGPFTTVRHFVVRSGEPGFHIATEFRHSADVHGFNAEQHRFVLRVDPSLFTAASVEDDPFGVRWRAGAATLPTPAELRAAPAVMDATDDLNGLGSRYPRRYYTKYDWATYLKDHVLHGLYGKGFGVWAVLADKEAFGGGPVRQDLTLHQTDTTPLVLVEPQATHYGAPTLAVRGAWSKTYGPYFIALNTGTDPVAMRADAMRHADPAYHRAFYDRLALPGWVPATRRSTVTGRVTIAPGPDAGGAVPMTGAVAVLSDNRVDFQRTVLGYQYWTNLNVDGSFALPAVRPGTYRLTVYKPGVWGEFVRDDVTVTAGSPLRIPDAPWTPLSNGRTLWQIGTPDRTSVEFRRGAEFRQWGMQRYYPTDFPTGVVYTVGTSTGVDWNYVQYQKINGQSTPPWRIRFPLTAAPAAAETATLTIALAAWSLDTARPVPDVTTDLTIGINGGMPVLWSFAPGDARGSLYRSGTGGQYFRRELRFAGSLLRAGTNEITLQINGAGAPADANNWAAYDAIRLEVTG